MSTPQVLVVEDDPSIQRFIALALEEEPLAFSIVSTAADAMRHLRTAPVQLLLTDLMLPGASGADLMAALRADASLGPVARIAVLSAGLDAATRERLQALGAWRMLAKPVSLQELLACVRDALSPQGPPAAIPPGAPAAPTPVPAASAGWTAEERWAVDAHFGGDPGLFTAFQRSCCSQFPKDRVDGLQAFSNADWRALRRLAHSLKSVFAMLGRTGPSRCAAELEAACLQGDAQRIASAWHELSQHLTADVEAEK
ncbi:transcriptional regulator [Pseudorhodoferax aquiterrae]|uniref:Transcriptional regulator n=1 Tax=Pseudorhodoferax aquiterrae TaxID=747304 RepID=A0ABQ3G254_9BURK|nr:response regulator [Pseudorhodoferax aquiterrae]GHC84538.1 transcriptional regulator [Pseudorhodoferax aquiterrae]